MEAIFQVYVQELKSEPNQLNTVTDNLLREAAKEHHPQNRLLPASYIQMLLAQVDPQNIIGTNTQAQRYILALNCLRNILATNFPQLKDNKMFAAIIMNYSLTLNHLVQTVRQSCQGEQVLRFIARAYIINEIMLKLIQKAHIFVPQLLRSTKVALQVLAKHVQSCQEEVDEKQMKAINKLGSNSHVPKILYRLGSKKLWKKTHFILLACKLFWQAQNYLKTSGFSKNGLQIQAFREITQHFNQFKQLLHPSEQSILQSTEQPQKNDKQNENVYLQEPAHVKELTPRFYNEEEAFILSKLRRKKSKLTKKIQTDLRKGVLVKQQQAQVIEQVRREKGLRQQKKEQLIIQKQTVEVKKYNRQVKKIKMIRKGSKGKGKQGKGEKGGNRRGLPNKGR